MGAGAIQERGTFDCEATPETLLTALDLIQDGRTTTITEGGVKVGILISPDTWRKLHVAKVIEGTVGILSRIDMAARRRPIDQRGGITAERADELLGRIRQADLSTLVGPLVQKRTDKYNLQGGQHCGQRSSGGVARAVGSR